MTIRQFTDIGANFVLFEVEHVAGGFPGVVHGVHGTGDGVDERRIGLVGVGELEICNLGI
jgi:hypothetical protein